MKKKYILKNNYDFHRIINKKSPYRYKDYIIYIDYNGSSTYHFGISVGKKIGNAVKRNYYKRVIRNIIDLYEYRNGFDCIIILGKGILDKNYQGIKSSLEEAFKTLKIYKEES